MNSGNGFDQIDAALAQYQNLSAIHIVSHGSDGMIQLGGSWLTAGNIQQHMSELQNWGMALSETGDILIYGCDVAAGAQGQAFIDRIAVLTRADVAASTDKTGDSSRGGNWNFEYVAAAIPSPPALLHLGGEGNKEMSAFPPSPPWGRAAGFEGVGAIETLNPFSLHLKNPTAGSSRS